MKKGENSRICTISVTWHFSTRETAFLGQRSAVSLKEVWQADFAAEIAQKPEVAESACSVTSSDEMSYLKRRQTVLRSYLIA
jgi:hypothetical protein